MKALVKQTAGRGLTLTEVPEPGIRDDEVLIRVRSAGVCGTDVHIYEWDAWAPGAASRRSSADTSSPATSCSRGAARDRREGGRPRDRRGAHRRRPLALQPHRQRPRRPHTKIIGVDRDGCFAEYIAMPATNVWHLDDAISYEIGGIHDPMGNAFHTALTADIPGSVVLVTGCGPIGASRWASARRPAPRASSRPT
jgi:threonine 3-dehydrogenase